MSTTPYFEGIARTMPQSRYVLPSFEERTAYGYKRQDPYAKLFEDRIVFLGVQVDDASADDVMAQLLVLESQDPDSLITMYINSPGGVVTAGLAIYDTMQYISAPVATLCIGQAASMGAVLLAAGEKVMRYSLPHSRIMIHQPMGGFQGQASDIAIQAKEILRLRGALNGILASHTGQTLERVEQDTERDYFMSGEEAAEYGLIDQVLASRKELK